MTKETILVDENQKPIARVLVDENQQPLARMVDVRTVRNVIINELKIDREFIRELATELIKERLNSVRFTDMVQTAVNAASHRAVNSSVTPEQLKRSITTELQRVLADQIVINVTTKTPE